MKQITGIVTDSAADVPRDFLEKLNISVIPAYINFGLESIPDDGVSISRESFYQRLRTADPLPTTAAPSPGDAEKALREALERYDHVLAIHITKSLSAIIDSSRIAAESIGSERITVVDTGTLSMGAGWQVIVAAEAAAEGASPQDIMPILESVRERSRLWAVPATLEYLRRSGRVNGLIASLGEMLQLKPVIEVEAGKVLRAGRVRTFKKVIPKLIELAQGETPLQRLAILHLDNREGAENLRRMVQDFAPSGQTIIVWASPAIGANFGPGGLALATVRESR
ncbi:MAG TPA: DegV family protein [Aggregatilineales bacterium]|nr:DegV family protein [Aggregatilineales bacterium]